MNITKHNLSTLMLLPYFIAVTAMLTLDSGDKKLIPFIIISIIASLFLRDKSTIFKNLKAPFIWILSIFCLYAIFSYYYHGASSREVRALVGATLFLIFFPFNLFTQRLIQWIILIGSITIFTNSLYFNLYMGIARDAGYINPIPYSTACALISIISFSLMIENYSSKSKLIPFISFILSLPPVILSETRGVWLAFLFSIFMIITLKCITNPPSKRTLLFSIIFSLITTTTCLFLFKDNISKRYDNTFYEINKIKSNDYSTSFGLRLQMWMLAPDLIKEKPLLGHGTKQKEVLKEKLKRNEISSQLFHFSSVHYHNQFLDKMVKSGIIGLILIMGFLIYPMFIIKHLPQTDKNIVIGLVSLFFVAGLTDVPFNHPQPLILYLLFLVPICSRYKRVTND